MNQKITALACASLLTGFAAGHAFAEEPAKPSDHKAPATLASGDLSKGLDQYIIPSPADLLDALRRTTKIDWKALSVQIGKADAATKNAYPEDYKKALNLGVRVADAFVAVQAQDKDQFERSSGAVAKLGTELSADTNLNAKRDEAKKLIDVNQWPELGNLLEAIRFDVLKDLKAVPDEDSIILANLGGWVRGLDLVTGALDKNYTADATKLLRQAGLITYLKARVDKLEAPASTSKEVALIKAKLPEIEALCNFPTDGTLAQDKVKHLHEITTEIVQTIEK